MTSVKTVKGRVTLVGAGPGDPELLTVKAVRAIRRATVLLVDDLVGDGVLRCARRSARIIAVGKRGGGICAPRQVPPGPPGALPAARTGGRPSTPQAFIERLMIAAARRGERVVRLKGGDPFVFGRGGEEADALRAAGIAVEVIPGISAGVAAPAAIGVPLTDRRVASGVAFVTGHERDGGKGPDWAALARCGLTLVIYMGVTRCAAIRAALIGGGLDPATPAAIVQDATLPTMRALRTTLDALARVVAEHCIAAPAIIVVGEVVSLSAVLDSAVSVGDRGRAGRMPALAG